MGVKKQYIVVVTGVIFNDEGKILIAKRSDTEDVLPGYYCVPGGKVEEGANTSDVLKIALKREITEEVGIEVEIYNMFDSHIGKEEGKIHIYFKCKHISGEPQALEDTAEVYWMNLDEIKKLDKKSPMLYENCLKATGNKNIKTDCIFCKIANKEIPSMILFEDEIVMAIMDVNPVVTGHILVIPKNHFENIFITENSILERVNVVSKQMGLLLKEKLNCTGVNILNASGKDAQQSVNHLHYHIIPRYKNDNLDLWFHGSGKDKVDIKEVFEKLK